MLNNTEIILLVIGLGALVGLGRMIQQDMHDIWWRDHIKRDKK